MFPVGISRNNATSFSPNLFDKAVNHHGFDNLISTTSLAENLKLMIAALVMTTTMMFTTKMKTTSRLMSTHTWLGEREKHPHSRQLRRENGVYWQGTLFQKQLSGVCLISVFIGDIIQTHLHWIIFVILWVSISSSSSNIWYLDLKKCVVCVVVLSCKSSIPLGLMTSLLATFVLHRRNSLWIRAKIYL